MSKSRLRSWFSSLGLRFREWKEGRTTRRNSFRPAVEQLEDRTVLSTSIPLNGLTWTAVGPAPLGSGGPVSGRITGIAADPTNASIIYIAAAGGGVWKTTNGGTS